MAAGRALNVCVANLLVFALSMPGAYAGQADALKRLQSVAPDHAWDSRHALIIDIDADGAPDYVFLTQTPRAATIGLVLGKQGHRLVVRTIPIGDPVQDSLCAAPAAIGKESLNYVPPFEAVGVLPGFRRSKTGMSFELAGGECDAFHFFWNVQTNNLDYWRL